METEKNVASVILREGNVSGRKEGRKEAAVNYKTLLQKDADYMFIM